KIILVVAEPLCYAFRILRQAVDRLSRGAHMTLPPNKLCSLSICAIPLFFALILAPLALAQQSDEDFRQQAPLLTGGSVTVETGRGDVRVEAWDKAEILVEAYK